jgi:transglutaminase-like putative cysteine protease
MRRISILICLFLSGTLNLFSQSPSDMEIVKSTFKGEKSVVINDVEDVLIDVKGETFKITENITVETLILSDTKSYLAQEKVFESQFNKIIKIDAKTLIPTGNKYKAVKVDRIVDQKEQDNNVFYDEVVAKCFVFPSVQPGAITSLKYKKEVSNKFLLGAFYFKWYQPCVISQLRIKADKRAKIKFVLYNADSANIEFTMKEKGNYRVYSWTSRNISKASHEEDAPNGRYYLPHIVYTIDNSYPNDTVNTENLGLKGLYHYYYSFIKDLNREVEKPVKELVDSLVNGISDEDEKVRRIYYWVQDNISYVAFEEGMQGVVPESAIHVFNKRFGDCKGMSSILNYMLRLAGIDSYLTWIGTVDLPYKYSDIASQIIDNHMIVTYYDNKTPIFLDATNNFGTYGLPSHTIQGKQALVGIDAKNFKIEQVPVIADSISLITDSILFSIDKGIIEGKGSVTFTGYEKKDKAYSLDGNDKLKTKEIIIDLLTKGSNKFFIDSFFIENLYNREEPLGIHYNFKINDYYKEIDNEIYLNLNLDKKFYNKTIDTLKRTVPLARKYHSEMEYISVFEIPQGYQIEFMPRNAALKSDEFEFSILYTIEGNKIIRRSEIRSNFLILQPNEFCKWNSVIEGLNKAYRDVLILKKV